MRAGRIIGLLAPICLAAVSAPVMAADCPIARAVYMPAGGDGQREIGQYQLFHTTKKLDVNMSKLALTIQHNGLKRAHDFGFAFPNGYGGTRLLYAGPDKYEKDRNGDGDDEGPGSSIMYFDAQMRAVEAPTAPDVPAPQFLIMPEIGLKFWYVGQNERKFVPPDGMWKLTSCR